MSALLRLENLSAGYDSKTIISEINLDLKKGDFCALLGLNGCGKTTLLKAITGLLSLKCGSCLIQGLDSTRLSENMRARYISYIPQRHSKLDGVTVLDAVMMGFYAKLGFLEFPGSASKAAALEALKKMGLESLAGDDFSRLSEGQKQLVILTRTLIQNTPLILMDEPDSALDFQNSRRIMAKFRHLVKMEAKAALISLHDPGLALNYCDRLLLMNNGKIVFDIYPYDSDITKIEKSLSSIYNGIVLREFDGSYAAMLRVSEK